MNKKSLFQRLKAFILKRIYPTPSKRGVSSLIGKLRPVQTEVELIRLGGNRDGGYLLPNDLENIEACFSPGVGSRSFFEKACADLRMEVFMSDASVENPMIENKRFHFTRKYIGGNRKPEFISLQQWIDSTNIAEASDLILQMDIEGYEYEALQDISIETLQRFRIIIIEFHMLTSVGSGWYYHRFKKVIEKLLQHHSCVHIHPNNCCGSKTIHGIDVPGVAEFTFYRNDRFRNRKPVRRLPHELDFDNVQRADSLELSQHWYKEI